MEIFWTKEFWYFVIPVIIGIIFYYSGKSTKDERNHLLLMYKSTQMSSKRLQDKIKQFIIDSNVSDEIMFPEKQLTFGVYLEILIEDYEKSLSDDKYHFIMKEKKLNKPTLQSMVDSITKQNDELRNIEVELDLIMKRVRSKS
jgi:hypothetical protein